MRIIWLAANVVQNGFEYDWLKLLLPQSINLDLRELEAPATLSKKEPLLIITDLRHDASQLMRLCIDQGVFFGIILLSDETLSVDLEVPINSEYCIFIARNHFSPRHSRINKLWHFGLGHKNGFVGRNDSHIVKNLVWSFAGNTHVKERKKAIKVFEKLSPNNCMVTSSFNSIEGYGVEKYCSVLAKSLFVLCPQGYVNNDSFRVYESLLSGAIPVCLSSDYLNIYYPSYWHFLFGRSEIPFVVHSRWKDCLKEVEELLSNPQKLETKQAQCRELIESSIIAWQASFAYSIEALLSEKPFPVVIESLDWGNGFTFRNFPRAIQARLLREAKKVAAVFFRRS